MSTKTLPPGVQATPARRHGWISYQRPHSNIPMLRAEYAVNGVTLALYVGDGDYDDDYIELTAEGLDTLVDTLKHLRRKHFGKRQKAGGVVAGDSTDPT